MKYQKSSGLFSRIKVQHQLHIIFFIAIFIPVLLLGNYLLYNSRTLLADHYREQSHSDNLRVKSLLLDLTSNTEYIHPVTDAVQQESWYPQATGSATPFWTVESQTDRFNRTTPLLTLHCRIFLPQKSSFAILNVSVSNNHIKNRIENSSLKTVVWLNENSQFYQSGSRTITTLPDPYRADPAHPDTDQCFCADLFQIFQPP